MSAKDLSKIHLRGQLVNNVGLAGAKKGVGRHLQPGVVKYQNEDGSEITYLLEKEGIDAMRPSAAGIPIAGASTGFDHVKVEPGKEYDGKVTDSFWDGESGWEAFHFEGMNQPTAEACNEGYQFSCAYVPTEVDETPGKWHNVPYDAVIKNGRYTHVAVVPEPRYDGATIELQNALKSGGIVNKTIKALLAACMPANELKELANAVEADEKKAKAKTDFDNAMKNAKTDEEKAAAKTAFDNAMAAADQPGGADDPLKKAAAQQATAERMNKVKALRNAAEGLAQLHPDKSKMLNDEADKLEKMPLGGGDVTPDPGVSQAQETPEDKAKREQREGANAMAAKQEQAENKNAAAAWASFAPGMIEDESVAEKVLSVGGKPIQFNAQPIEVRNTWRATVAAATGDTVAEKVEVLTAKAAAVVELKNALKEKAAKAVERFNALKLAAAQRGSDGSIPGSLTGDSMEDKIALGKQLYSSERVEA